MRGIPVPSRFEKDSHDYLDVVMTMIDFLTPKILAHRRNLERYARLLATQLTDLEREYIHKRIAEEQAELERLELLARRAQNLGDATQASFMHDHTRSSPTSSGL